MKTSLAIFLSSLAVATASYAQTNLWQNSGNIGIGTTSPGNKLTVVGGPVSLTGDTNAIWNAASFYSIDSSGRTYAFGSRAGIFSVSDESVGAVRFVINNAGNVGIGTWAPAASLQVGDNFNGVPYNTKFFVNSGGVDRFGRLVISPDGNGAVGAVISGYFDNPTFTQKLILGTIGYSGVEQTMILQNGNVGIGTTGPTAKLSIVADQSGASALSITDPAGFCLDRGVITTHVDRQTQLALVRRGVATWGFDITPGGTAVMTAQDSGMNILAMQLGGGSAGNVGIGTTSPSEKLSVNGRIRAREVIVETTNWSDHVFADSYRLQPLAEVEQHIKTEKHLPGVPSAQEVAEKGVSVGDMQAILLAKIEEITLHQIAQEKAISSLQSKVKSLEVENAQLKALTK
ncbi:MAG: hypothetical protein QM715_20190 [Nibricoccus sp.]